MTTSHARLSVMAGILGLVAILGIVWLVRVAAGGDPSQNDPASAQDDSAPGASSGGTPTADGTNGPASSSAGSTSPPNPRDRQRSIRVNGVRLDGNPIGDGCVVVINKTSAVAVFTNVTFTLMSGEGSGVGLSPASSTCDNGGDPPCVGTRMQTGGQCLAGVRLTGQPAPGTYRARANVSYRYTCTSKEDNPCNYPVLSDVAMSPDAPVEVFGTTSNNVPEIEIFVDGPSPPGTENTPIPIPEDT